MKTAFGFRTARKQYIEKIRSGSTGSDNSGRRSPCRTCVCGSHRAYLWPCGAALPVPQSMSAPSMIWCRGSALLHSLWVLACRIRFIRFGSILHILQHIREIQNYPDSSRPIFSLQYSLPHTSPLLKHTFKLFQYPGQLRGQPLTALLLQILRHAVKSLGDAAGDGSQRIAVAAERYRRA